MTSHYSLLGTIGAIMRRMGLFVVLFHWGVPLQTQAQQSLHDRNAHSWPIAFSHGDRSSKLNPRYSPVGTRIPLKPATQRLSGIAGSDVLQGILKLGPKDSGNSRRLFAVARSVPGQPYDRLVVDTNGDGHLADEEMLVSQPREIRGTTRTSFLATIQILHPRGNSPALEPYPVNFWLAVEAPNATPAFIRYSRMGFLYGAVMLEGKRYDVILSDANNDAVFSGMDWWELRSAAFRSTDNPATSRNVDDFCWADGKAYKLLLEGTSGRNARLETFFPEVTEEEDAIRRDRYHADRIASRAPVALKFRHDVDQAVVEARSRGLPYYLDFETSWCGPCKLMDNLVYTSAAVVESAQERGIVCIKIDGDERKDWTNKLKVGAYPTGVLFDSYGRAVGRYTGYMSVAKLTTFFHKVPKKR